MTKFADVNQKFENCVVLGYQKIENAVTGTYQKIEDKFVDTFLAKEGESTEDAKIRIKKEQEETAERNNRQTSLKKSY